MKDWLKDGRQLKSQPHSRSPGGGKNARLVQKWPQPTVSARTLYQFGPNATRDKESTLKLTAILERRGFLVPMATNRCDSKKWRIALGP